jgi:two-component system, response regulator, stage 0 sporulation protein A
MTINDPDAVSLITELIYPYIAKMHATTSSRVNRAMCHALDVAWDRGSDSPLATAILPAKTSKPTNREFILALGNFLISHELIETDNKL